MSSPKQRRARLALCLNLKPELYFILSSCRVGERLCERQGWILMGRIQWSDTMDGADVHFSRRGGKEMIGKDIGRPKEKINKNCPPPRPFVRQTFSRLK